MTSIGSSLLLSALSCITLNIGELCSLSIQRNDIIPSEYIGANKPVNFEDYSIKTFSISNETIKLDDDILSEYNVILTFANKLLSENIHIDMEIQNIIDEHFWDML